MLLDFVFSDALILASITSIGYGKTILNFLDLYRAPIKQHLMGKRLFHQYLAHRT